MLSLSFSLSLPYRNALFVSSSRNICPRAAFFPSTPFNPQRVVFIHRELANHRLASRIDQIIREIPSAEAYTNAVRGYTVPATHSAFEIILVDTHAWRLIALGFSVLHSRTEETAIRSGKRQAIVIYLSQNATLIIDNWEFLTHIYFFHGRFIEFASEFLLDSFKRLQKSILIIIFIIRAIWNNLCQLQDGMYWCWFN